MLDTIDVIYVVSKELFSENCTYIYCAFKHEREAKAFCEDRNKNCVNGKYDYEEVEIIEKRV